MSRLFHHKTVQRPKARQADLLKGFLTLKHARRLASHPRGNVRHRGRVEPLARLCVRRFVGVESTTGAGTVDLQRSRLHPVSVPVIGGRWSLHLASASIVLAEGSILPALRRSLWRDGHASPPLRRSFTRSGAFATALRPPFSRGHVFPPFLQHSYTARCRHHPPSRRPLP